MNFDRFNDICEKVRHDQVNANKKYKQETQEHQLRALAEMVIQIKASGNPKGKLDISLLRVELTQENIQQALQQQHIQVKKVSMPDVFWNRLCCTYSMYERYVIDWELA